MNFIQRNQLVVVSVIVSLIMISISFVYISGQNNLEQVVAEASSSRIEFEETVAPEDGVELPVVWGDFGKKLVESGAIDKNKFEQIYRERAASSEASLVQGGRGGLSVEERKLLYGIDNGKLFMNRENAGFLLNLLWGFGLANMNPVLDHGPMVNYGGEPGLSAEALAKAGGFASTGGWTIASGNPMDHYSQHKFIVLTEDQQKKVDDVSKNIYRPCCGNPVYFPDCNHGMAMLGLLELMASQGVKEKDMWGAALVVNSYWFPDTYLTIATYMEDNGVDWGDVSPQEILGINYSSAQGYANISSQVDQQQRQRGGNGCGVDA